jgi:shikimate 5-dehydrogenase
MHRNKRSAGTAVRTDTDALASRAGIASARRASVLRGWSLLDVGVGGAVAVALHCAAMQVWEAVISFRSRRT